MSKVIRSVKNVTKGYSNVQIKVREGGSGRLLARHAPLRRAAAGAHRLWIALLTASGCSDQQ